MKALVLILSFFALPCFGDVEWSHRVKEGEDGGIAGSYFFYKTFKPDYGDGTLMSVEKVRAVHVGNGLDGSTVIDYSMERSGIYVKVSTADKKAVMELISGKDADLKAVSEFSVKGELCVGEFNPKPKSALTEEQREMIYNLVYILAMQRSPIKSDQAGADQPATRSESKPEGKGNPKSVSEERSR